MGWPCAAVKTRKNILKIKVREMKRTIARIKLLGNGRCVVLQLLKQSRCNGQEINASKGLDLTDLLPKLLACII